MYRRFVPIAMMLVVAGVVAGCAHKMKTAESGFLDDYSKLEKVDDDFSFYRASDYTLKNYPMIIVDPIQFNLDAEVAKDFTEEQRREIREYAQQTVNKILSPHLKIVTQPGPGVARVRMAFTDIEKSEALLNLYPATRAAGVGRGGAAVEGEILDSQSGTQLVAWTRRGKGTLLQGSGVGSLSDIKTVIDHWAADANKRVVPQLIGG
ncbi:MAG: DUF3313 domain-containing protein [Gammaproteobacteria bacterium]|nr:DUF3313 domain-containing protein [Gammaproteobacteria bacterium]